VAVLHRIGRRGLGTAYVEGFRAALDAGADVVGGVRGRIDRERHFGGKDRAIEAARGGLKPGETFYYADEFNISWHPTIRAMWSPVGRQVMIPTPAQPIRRYGLGAVDWHSGEVVVLTRRRKRRREVAELLEALLARHPKARYHAAARCITLSQHAPARLTASALALW